MGGKCKKPKVSLSQIPWSENNNSRVWKLITELGQRANYEMLFGKKDKHEKILGETKATVYKRIGAAVLPEFHEISPKATGDRVKGKLDLTKKYIKHAAKRRITGKGLHESQDSADGDPSDKMCRFYIGANGPDVTTSEEANRLWEEIQTDFPFFAELHRIFAAQPNVAPIVVTTGVGSHANKTIHMQPPGDDKDNIIFTASQVSQIRTLQDALNLNLVGTAPLAAPPFVEFVDEKENNSSIHPVTSSPTPIRKIAPMPSLLSHDNIHKITPKHSIEDTLFDMQRYMIVCSKLLYLMTRNRRELDTMHARHREERFHRKRNCLLEEFMDGIWDAAEYHQRLDKMDDSKGPSKRPRHESPEWDSTSFSVD
ncbi:hypothetical protein DFJ58DRAFT_736950 [Suillus subalutaceus]|uniref:uncharacterized protein n=1 Tax=Suillus subalutaceus TaxID=48586 RepID=UPI001B881E31|nr:uncharacterized protein DFJ58DRAFT_736950 [Suillus subalutaceus]KAG1830494.1 hypothetical protein DFJ58DRAFT_736950 [Suillus subalutaceus]